MQSDSRFRSLLKPVREVKSLAGDDLRCTIEEVGAVAPIQLNRPGLHTFKVAAFCDVEGNGPVSRIDVVSVMVGPGRPSMKQSSVKDLVIKEKDSRGVLVMITPKSEGGFLFGAGLADEIDVKVSGHKHEINITDLLDGTYHVEIIRIGKAVEAIKSKISIVFKDVLLWESTI